MDSRTIRWCGLVLASCATAGCLFDYAAVPLSESPASSPKVVTVAGTGTSGFADGQALGQSLLSSPRDVAVGAAGPVVFTDAGNRRLRQLQQVMITTVGEPYEGIAGVTIGADGVIYVAAQHRIWRTAGGETTALTGADVGFADGPLGAARFNAVEGIAIDATGALYVADSGNHAIRRIADGNVTTIAGTGQPGFADGEATVAKFQRPTALAVDADGVIYVADTDNHRIRKIVGGAVSTVAGDGKQSQFNKPQGIAIDGEGRLYVADSANHRIRVVIGDSVVTVAGTGTAGGTDGPVKSATLSTPRGLARDADGSLYIADSGSHRIRRLTGLP